MWAQWRYDNGVYGVMSTGRGTDFVDATCLLRGTDGTIRIGVEGGPTLELERGGRTEAIDVDGETLHRADPDADRFGSRFIDRAVDEVVDALRHGRRSELDGRIGLNTAEILFGGYESVRRRGRVDVPLDIDDNPLEALIESGALSPASPTDPTA